MGKKGFAERTLNKYSEFQRVQSVNEMLPWIFDLSIPIVSFWPAVGGGVAFCVKSGDLSYISCVLNWMSQQILYMYVMYIL